MQYKQFKDISTFFDFVNEFEAMLKGGKVTSVEKLPKTGKGQKNNKK